MSDPSGHMPEREALAAEYVLGTLSLPERLAAEALLESDVNFAALVEDWQNRLAPMNDAFDPVSPPPELLNRIEARLFPTEQQKRGRGWLWGLLAGAAVAILALVMVLPIVTRPTEIAATLTGEGQPLIVAARFDPDAGELTVTRSEGPAAETGRDYELWLIPAGGSPVPVGLVRDGDLTAALDTLPSGATLAITLEPEGGSPTGEPTGPVLVSAVVGE